LIIEKTEEEMNMKRKTVTLIPNNNLNMKKVCAKSYEKYHYQAKYKQQILPDI
jgi:hypothetical protein